jgi:large subunit ribosomal protein L6
MSYIGKKNIRIPQDIQVQVCGNVLKLKNLKNTKKIIIPEVLECLVLGSKSIQINLLVPLLKHKAIWGTFRSILHQTIQGLSQGFSIVLVLKGIGYNVSFFEEAKELHFKIGFSDLVKVKVPSTIQVFLPKRDKLILYGNNLQEISQYAAKIRSYRLPNSYKIKGILYKGETYKLKEGKKK